MNDDLFYPKPIMPFIKMEKSKDDIMIDGIVEGLKMAGISGDDISFMVIQTLKQMGRYDLLPPCEREGKE